MATKTNEDYVEEFRVMRPVICSVSTISDDACDWLRTLLASKDMEREEAVKEGRHAALTWVNILLGYKSPEKIRELIERDLAELEAPPHTEAKEIIRED